MEYVVINLHMYSLHELEILIMHPSNDVYLFSPGGILLVPVEECTAVLYAYRANGRCFSQSSSFSTYVRNSCKSERLNRSTIPSPSGDRLLYVTFPLRMLSMFGEKLYSQNFGLDQSVQCRECRTCRILSHISALIVTASDFWSGMASAHLVK